MNETLIKQFKACSEPQKLVLLKEALVANKKVTTIKNMWKMIRVNEDIRMDMALFTITEVPLKDPELLKIFAKDIFMKRINADTIPFYYRRFVACAEIQKDKNVLDIVFSRFLVDRVFINDFNRYNIEHKNTIGIDWMLEALYQKKFGNRFAMVPLLSNMVMSSMYFDNFMLRDIVKCVAIAYQEHNDEILINTKALIKKFKMKDFEAKFKQLEDINKIMVEALILNNVKEITLDKKKNIKI